MIEKKGNFYLKAYIGACLLLFMAAWAYYLGQLDCMNNFKTLISIITIIIITSGSKTTIIIYAYKTPNMIQRLLSQSNGMSLRSTLTLKYTVSLLEYLFSFSTDLGANFGKPLAMFISLVGFWKDELLASGMKLCVMWEEPSDGVSWFNKEIVTFCLKGHGKRSSCSDFIITKKTETCVPFPLPSPFR